MAIFMAAARTTWRLLALAMVLTVAAVGVASSAFASTQPAGRDTCPVAAVDSATSDDELPESVDAPPVAPPAYVYDDARVLARGDGAGAFSDLGSRFVAPNTASMSGGAGSPAVVHHPRGSVRVGRDADTVAFAARAEVRPGELTVSVHGTPSGYAPGASTADVASAIRAHPNYNPNQTIMYSCYAGSNGTAARLAAELGQPVRAPTGVVHLDPGASVPWLPAGTRWSSFG
jgi:hypothetical protein